MLMNTTNTTIILLIAGIGITAVVAFLVFRPKTSSQTYKVVQSYQNKETWNFIKDENGRVTGVTVYRKAEQQS